MLLTCPVCLCRNTVSFHWKLHWMKEMTRKQKYLASPEFPSQSCQGNKPEPTNTFPKQSQVRNNHMVFQPSDWELSAFHRPLGVHTQVLVCFLTKDHSDLFSFLLLNMLSSNSSNTRALLPLVQPNSRHLDLKCTHSIRCVNTNHQACVDSVGSCQSSHLLLFFFFYLLLGDWVQPALCWLVMVSCH